MATVTREQLQKALSSLSALEGMASGYCELQDGFDTSKGIAENVRQLLAALASPPAEDETRELAIARHALALIEPHTTRGITDCSTPLHIRVQNIVEGLEKAEREIERLKALAQPNRGDAIRLTACMAGFKPCADCQHREFCRSWLDGVGRCVKAQAPPASDPPGLATSNGLTPPSWLVVRFTDQTGPQAWEFTYEQDARAFFASAHEQWRECYLTRVVQAGSRVLADRQSDPPGLVASLREQVRRWRERSSGIDDDNSYNFNSERHARANQMDECADEIEELLPTSPQAETKRDCTCLGACRGDEGLSPRYRCVLAPPQAETTKGGR